MLGGTFEGSFGISAVVARGVGVVLVLGLGVAGSGRAGSGRGELLGVSCE